VSPGKSIVVFRHLSSGWTLTDGWTDELASEIRQRLPDVPVRVATSVPEMKEAVSTEEIVVTLELPSEVLDEAASLRWVQALTAGVNSYDHDQLRESDVVLTSASGVHSEPIAQHAFAYLLAFERGIKRGMEQQREGVWEVFQCGELTDKTLGIVGLGSIGKRVADVGSAFGMRVIGTKRDTNVTIDAVDQVLPPADLETVLNEVDYLVLSCPLTDQTQGLIGRDELEAMDRSAILVNVARGEVVDEAALIDTLEADQIRGAGLDVFEKEPLPKESPLWDLSNVVLTPHIAGSSPYYWERCAELVAENYRHFITGELDAMVNHAV